MKLNVPYCEGRQERPDLVKQQEQGKRMGAGVRMHCDTARGDAFSLFSVEMLPALEVLR